MAAKGLIAPIKAPECAMGYPPELLAEFGSWAIARCSRTGPHREHLAILSVVTTYAGVTGFLPLCGLMLYVLTAARKFNQNCVFPVYAVLGYIVGLINPRYKVVGYYIYWKIAKID